MAEQNTVSIICQQNELPIILLQEFRIKSYVKGYHAYKGIWKPQVGDMLKTAREPENEVDKFAVAVFEKKGSVVGHLKKGERGKIAKLFSYFLKTESEFM